MANEVRKITLTGLGTDAGPYFSVQYSTNCITYSQSVDCTNIFLPSVGSFAYCTVDQDTQCVRLTSLSELCGNSVIEDLPTTSTTSTTSTTQAPTTSTTLSPTTTTTLSPTTTTSTTSTTTVAPTTTTVSPTSTTTQEPTRYLVELCGGGDGPYSITLGSGTLPTGIGQAYKLTGSYSGFNGTDCWEVLENPTTASLDYSNVGFGSVFSNCSECIGTTSTTTVSPTTTSTTTQAPTIYEVELCGGGLGPYLVTLASGDLPAGIGQAYKISGNSGAGFNGSNCWEVLTNPATGTPDYTNLAFGTVFSNCSECIGTTSTTTVAPTTSTTTLAPTTTTLACYSCNGGTITFSTGALDYGQYPTRDVCSTSDTCFVFNWNVIERPNRFNVYDNNGLLWTSGWVGVASYSGPWGSSLNTATSGNSGTLQFGTTNGRYVMVEYGPADSVPPQLSDTAEWSLSCATCPTTTTAAPTTSTTTAVPTTTAAPTTTTTQGRELDWSYTLDGGATGVMDIYINSTAVETRSSNSSGTWPLSVGDVIYFEVYTTSCSGGNDTANSYTLVPGVPSYSILADAACTNGVGTITLTTGTYTVQSSDGIIYVDAFSSCDAGCI